MKPILTEHLELVPATLDLLRAALSGPSELAARLGVGVPTSWPPEHVDAAALEFTIARLEEGGDEAAAWWLHLVVLREGRLLVGTVGFKGAPDGNATVEVGYSIAVEHRRRGYATEAVRGLLRKAFAAGARRVIAETLPELGPSIGVLEKAGFQPIGEGSEPGILRFEALRDHSRTG